MWYNTWHFLNITGNIFLELYCRFRSNKEGQAIKKKEDKNKQISKIKLVLSLIKVL